VELKSDYKALNKSNNMKTIERKVPERIVIIKPEENGIGAYFSYCSFGYHKGIVVREKARLCVSRECKYYSRFYQLEAIKDLLITDRTKS